MFACVALVVCARRDKAEMSRTAKFTLLGAILLSSFTIWAVHFQQDQEREVSIDLRVTIRMVDTYLTEHVQRRSAR